MIFPSNVVNLFSIGLPALVMTLDPSHLISNPIFVATLVALGFVIGIGIGASGIGGAVLIVPSLLYLGVAPQAMVGASLFFNFFTNILSSFLHAKKRNISWKGLAYLILAAVPSALLALWLWGYIEKTYGSGVLDIMILLPIGLALVGIAVSMFRQFRHLSQNASAQSNSMQLQSNISRKGRSALIFMGSLVSFIIQFSSIGAGAFLTPTLLKVLRSPKHVAGTSVTFGLVIALLGGLLHYSSDSVPMDLVAFLLVGSIPGSVLGVRIASTASPRKLFLIFTILILVSGLLISNRGITEALDLFRS